MSSDPRAGIRSRRGRRGRPTGATGATGVSASGARDAVEGTLLWDFDGTLASRPGLWSGAMVEVLDREFPGHGLTRDDFRPALHDGFPWHRADEPHLHLCDPEAWWNEVGRLIRAGYEAEGYDRRTAARLTSQFRSAYLDAGGWTVFEDTPAALTELSAAGWRHVIVSNHVPELADLVTDLGLAGHFDRVVSSAIAGYDKPHPEIFRIATDGLPEGRVVMVGDNPVADIDGARAAGIEGILVRRSEDPRSLPDLHALVECLTTRGGAPGHRGS